MLPPSMQRLLAFPRDQHKPFRGLHFSFAQNCKDAAGASFEALPMLEIAWLYISAAGRVPGIKHFLSHR
jgi:hypothetical protein